MQESYLLVFLPLWLFFFFVLLSVFTVMHWRVASGFIVTLSPSISASVPRYSHVSDGSIGCRGV